MTNSPSTLVRYTSEFLIGQSTKRPVQLWELGNRAAAADIPEPQAFKPIGRGLPLVVEVREIYTGKHPGLGGFWGDSPKKKNLLLASAVRGWADDEAAPRAVNCITEEKIGAKTHLTIPGALNKGTSVVYYSPAMLLKSLTVRFEMVFDEFDPSVIDAISNGFRAASGLPIFLPYGAYLLAASTLLKLVSATGDRLFDGSPVFWREKVLNFESVGVVNTEAGYYLLAPEDRSIPQIKSLWEDYAADANGEYRHKTNGQQWQGDYPYILYTLDGSNHDDVLGGWAATALSAGEIERFYNVKNREAEAVNLLVDGLKSYNDLKYWAEARKVKAAEAAETDTVKKTALAKKRDALIANILDSGLKTTV